MCVCMHAYRYMLRWIDQWGERTLARISDCRVGTAGGGRKGCEERPRRGEAPPDK